ncbi:MAG: hypothetical protein AB7U39_15890, partial [Ilumatobacteraceae bacterium]
MQSTRTLRERSRRSVAVLVGVMVVTGAVAPIGTRHVIEAFRHSAERVDRLAAVADDLEQEVVDHATIVAAPLGSVPDEQVDMLEDAIRLDFGRALDEQDDPNAKALLAQSFAAWTALVRDVDRLPAGDGRARGSAVTERVPEVLSLLDRSTATSRAAVRADVRDAERTERLVLGVIAALELLAVWLVVRLVRSTSAEVIGPLGALRDSANRLAAGEIDHRVTVERAD